MLDQFFMPHCHVSDMVLLYFSGRSVKKVCIRPILTVVPLHVRIYFFYRKVQYTSFLTVFFFFYTKTPYRSNHFSSKSFVLQGHESNFWLKGFWYWSTHTGQSHEVVQWRQKRWQWQQQQTKTTSKTTADNENNNGQRQQSTKQTRNNCGLKSWQKRSCVKLQSKWPTKSNWSKQTPSTATDNDNNQPN
jgi:hypothetical protein